MPRQDRLFDLFAQHAKTVVGAAETLQFVSASLYSLGHTGNDAQKTMGIIAVCYIRKDSWRVISMCRSWSSFHAKVQ
jgi:phosphate/sulfate permease